ncbi:MAG TPA: rod shape-determining protein MreC [Sunxiuqinia sp.]|nr:rod shape-determining protein MreC [Sunxiuqinia sp.]
MRSLLHFLARHSFLLLFLVLEIVSLILIVNYNNFQRVKFLNSSNQFTGSLYEMSNNFTNYFHLNRVNEELAAENAQLRTQLQQYKLHDIISEVDSSYREDTIYQFIPAKVINNSVNKRFNYVTLNKGKLDSIEPDMGIIGPNGIVGVINNVSDHYSSGPTILNKRWGVSAKIKKNNYFGPISWDGQDYQHAELKEIPFHVQLSVGDTVITSGHSAIFPEGILIGTIESFNHKSGANFYEINVRLSTNFKTISHVELVKHNFKEERKQLEELNSDD